MQIGEVIRKYRKEKNLTQEEMARALGVTAPAVNKWENGNSLPDVMLLAPIARLLGITLDTLLAFQEDLTEEEMNSLIGELNDRLKREPYEEVFQWAKKKREQFPNCEKLFLNMAVVLDAGRLVNKVPDAEKYTDEIIGSYVRALDSKEEETRYRAADSLYNFYVREEQYEKAEEYLTRFPDRDPEKKRKQAQICARTGRWDEAYKAYEELLFSGYQRMSIVLNGIYQLAAEEQDTEKARLVVGIQRQLAQLLEMGKYYELMWELEPAMSGRDADAAVDIAEKLLENIPTIGSYMESRLYEHMGFRRLGEEFYNDLKEKLVDFGRCNTMARMKKQMQKSYPGGAGFRDVI